MAPLLVTALLSLGGAGCSTSPPPHPTTATSSAGIAARWERAVTPVELAADEVTSALESETSWGSVEKAAAPYVAALRAFDAELPRLGLKGEGARETAKLLAADERVIAALTAAGASPPAGWQGSVGAQATALDSIESALGLATGSATLAPQLDRWYADHAAMIRHLATEFADLGEAVAATSRSPGPASLASLHDACASLLSSATADATVPVPEEGPQEAWRAAITLVGTGSADCLNGIAEVDTALLEEGITRLAAGEHGLRRFLADEGG